MLISLREEFMTNVNRDIYSSLAQHDDHFILVILVIMNEPMDLLRQKMIKKMTNPIQNNAKKPEN